MNVEDERPDILGNYEKILFWNADMQNISALIRSCGFWGIVSKL